MLDSPDPPPSAQGAPMVASGPRAPHLPPRAPAGLARNVYGRKYVRGRTYAPSLRVHAAEMLMHGIPVSEIARKLSVSRSFIYLVRRSIVEGVRSDEDLLDDDDGDDGFEDGGGETVRGGEGAPAEPRPNGSPAKPRRGGYGRMPIDVPLRRVTEAHIHEIGRVLKLAMVEHLSTQPHDRSGGRTITTLTRSLLNNPALPPLSRSTVYRVYSHYFAGRDDPVEAARQAVIEIFSPNLSNAGLNGGQPAAALLDERRGRAPRDNRGAVRGALDATADWSDPAAGDAPWSPGAEETPALDTAVCPELAMRLPPDARVVGGGVQSFLSSSCEDDDEDSMQFA
jgi:hypothetical protein